MFIDQNPKRTTRQVISLIVVYGLFGLLILA